MTARAGFPVRRWYRCAGVFLGAMLVLGLSAGPALADLEELTVPFDALDVTVTTDNDGHAVFACPRGVRLSQTGEPDLPWQVITVLLPPDVDMDTVQARLQPATYVPVDGTWSVAPVPPLATWDGARTVLASPAEKLSADGRDTTVYEQDAYWPPAAARLLHAGRLRKWRLTEVALPLLRFNPVDQTLERLISGTVVVSFARAKAGLPALSAAEAADRIGQDRVQRIAVNFDQQRADYQVADSDEAGAATSTSTKDAGPGYVILTRSTIASSLTELSSFVAHKQMLGHSVQVVTEAQWGGGDGNTAAENIRAWLQTHYVGDNIAHVLLIGDPRPGTGNEAYKVPMKMLWPRYNESDYREAPSDYYYADLTGNWDRDGDGYYGEWSHDFGSGGVDRYWEVLVGRVPHYGSGSTSATDAILRKTMDYEMEVPADWRTSALLPMEPSDASTPGYHLGEQIKNNFLVPESWSYHRVYESTYGLTPPPETTPCNVTNVTNVWSSNPFGLVVWWTHGSSTSAADIMDIYHVPSLNDNYPAFTFQVSCYNAYPETTNNLAYELLKHGAVSTVAATRVSWYYVGQTSFSGSPSNSGMGYEYTRRIVTDNDSTGLALQDMKQSLNPGSSAIWMNFCVFNIYGDPSVAVISPPRVHNMTQDLWYPAIQPAIDGAATGNEIVLMPMLYKGDLNTDLDFGGKSITLRSGDPTDADVVAMTVIDCEGTGRAFVFDSGESAAAVVAGLTITGAGNSAILCTGSGPTIVNTVIAGNAGSDGGGIFCGAGCAARIDNCLITRNSASGSGGGIYCAAGASPVITGSAVVANTASGGAGVYVQAGATATIANTIVWGNSTGQVSGAADVSFCCIQGWAGGGQGNISDDPLFLDPDGPDNNPLTWQDNDLRLPQHSPCVDAGSNAALPDDTADLDGDGITAEPIPYDLAGHSRVAYGIVDIGPYEFIVLVAPDFDGDGDVDHGDFGHLQLCLSGSGTAQTLEECQDARLDDDGDVDYDDVLLLMGCKAGARAVPEADCMD